MEWFEHTYTILHRRYPHVVKVTGDIMVGRACVSLFSESELHIFDDEKHHPWYAGLPVSINVNDPEYLDKLYKAIDDICDPS